MNAHTPTSDIANQLKSLTIDRADRAPDQTAMRSSNGRKLPWKAMLLTGMVAAVSATAWYNDVSSSAVFDGMFTKTALVTDTPVLTTEIAPTTLEISAPLAVAAPVVAQSFVGSGYVTADREAMLTPDVSGRLVDVRVAIGDTVTKGDVIAVLNSDVAVTDLRIAQANFAVSQAREFVAVAALAQARADVEIKDTLAQQGNVAKVIVAQARLNAQRLESDLAVVQQATVIAELEIAKQQDYLNRHIVTAPFTGVVVDRHLNGGDIVTSGLEGGSEGIVTLIDPAALTIEVDVAANNLTNLISGQIADVSLDAWPNETFTARVQTIAPKASIQRGTVQVRLSFETPPLGVFANMAAKVTFTEQRPTTDTLNEGI